MAEGVWCLGATDCTTESIALQACEKAHSGVVHCRAKKVYCGKMWAGERKTTPPLAPHAPRDETPAGGSFLPHFVPSPFREADGWQADTAF